MRRFSYFLVPLFLISILPPADAAHRVTLEALFDDEALALEEPSDLMWLPDGKAFLFRAPDGDEDVLWREEVENGKRSRVVTWSAMEEELEGQRPQWTPEAMSDPNSASSARTAPDLSPDGESLVICVAGDLARVDLGDGSARFLTGDARPEYFPTFSPDGERLAFVRDGDLFFLEMDSGVVHRLTDRGESTHLLNGIADWVYEEELGVERSFWWSPDGQRLAFVQYDVSPVRTVPILDSASIYPTAEEQRYPKAGSDNPKVRFGVLALDDGGITWLSEASNDTYIARAGWTSLGEVWVQRLNRDQNGLDLLVADPASGRARRVLSDRDDAWINIRDDLHFLSDDRFLWTSERDGWRHLYLFDRNGSLQRRLTSGEWQIDAVYGVDAEEKHAFIQANKDDLRQRHLFTVDLESGELSRLDGAGGGVHDATISPDGAWIIDHWSTLNSPPRWDLLKGTGKHVRTVWNTRGGLEGWDLPPMEAGSLTTAEGVELHSLLLRPRDFDPKRKYPVVHYVYGGPHSQLTKDRWGGSIHHTYRIFAEHGIAVFLVDNRGTWGRGHAFETIIHRRLGEFEVRDQLAAVDWLKEQSWVDGDRIAVYGGSYGGYLALMCMMQAPDVFRAGIAYAPVTDWRFYDSIYTERYMDTPQDNPEGYQASAPLNHVEKLEGSLLLAHGMMDNNVHLQNTVQLIGKLAAAKKDFEVVFYPQTRHGVRRSEFAPHFHRLKLEFLKRTLLGEEERQ